MKSHHTTLIKAIVGSTAYGTNVEGSDIDYKSVHVADKEEFINGTFKPQIEINKDDVSYEISRFLELLESGNPTVLELLFVPDDCIVEIHPLFEELRKQRDKFITKQLKNSFCGYAFQQITKAKGLDKKMNWEKQRIERKTPRDFCYITQLNNDKIYKFTDAFTENEMLEIGVIKLDHVADGYLMYSKKDCNSFYPIDSENSNSLKLSSIKKDVKPIGFLYFNKSEYTKHCADYLSYETWVKERNTQRYVDINEHGQKIDGKNMLHCMRLIDMSEEIATGKGLNVRRPNAEYLKSIRKGKVDLNTLLEEARTKLDNVKVAFDNSTLPGAIDENLRFQILNSIRKQVYDL